MSQDSFDLYTFVAGGVLEQDQTFNLKCNCGGDAPVTPTSTGGYGYSKKGGATKVVDKLQGTCGNCKASICAVVLEGDPGYVLTSSPDGQDQLLLPQGSSSEPVESLSDEDRNRMIDEIKRQSKGS